MPSEAALKRARELFEIIKDHIPLESAAGEPGDAGCSCNEPFTPYTWDGWCAHLAEKILESPALEAWAQARLTFAEFSRINRQRCESPDGFNHKLESWSTSDWFLAFIGEFGEAANIAKKLNRVRDGIPGNDESEEQLRAKLRNELGDAFVYLDLLAQSVGVEIGEAAVEVFNAKSEKLGCPIRIAALEQRTGSVK